VAVVDAAATPVRAEGAGSGPLFAGNAITLAASASKPTAPEAI